MDQTSLFSSTDSVFSKNYIGCCSRYRDCSNAGFCLIPSYDISQNCYYRKALESGKIFYGKRSPYFDKALYFKLQTQLQLLTIKQREALFGVLNFFFRTKQGTLTYLFYDNEEYSKLANMGFFSIESSSDAISSLVVDRCRKDVLEEACGNSIQDAISWAAATRKSRGKSPSSTILREDLIEWILTYDRHALKKLCAGLVVISLDPFPTSFTLEEWFWDNKAGDYPLSMPDNDQRFLKQKSTKIPETEEKHEIFHGWDDDILIESDQVMNRLNAEKIKASNVKIDRSSLRGEIQGSASIPYQTDLSGCTCPDFNIRKKPCKHMYRLALELELIAKFPEVDGAIEKAIVQSAAQKWKDEFTLGHISAQLYARVEKALQK